MPIPVRCPACDTPHNLSDTLAGKKIRCKKCQASVAVPKAEIPLSPQTARAAAPNAAAVGPPLPAVDAGRLSQEEPPPQSAPAAVQPKAGRPVLSELARSVEFGFTAALLCGVLAVILVVVAFPLGETVYVQQRHSLVPGATQMVARKAPNLILVGLGLAACLRAFVPGLNALTLLPLLVWLKAADRAANRLAVQVAAEPEAAAAGKPAPASQARVPAATVGQERDELRPATPPRRAE